MIAKIKVMMMETQRILSKLYQKFLVEIRSITKAKERASIIPYMALVEKAFSVAI